MELFCEVFQWNVPPHPLPPSSPTSLPTNPPPLKKKEEKKVLGVKIAHHLSLVVNVAVTVCLLFLCVHLFV